MVCLRPSVCATHVTERWWWFTGVSWTLSIVRRTTLLTVGMLGKWRRGRIFRCVPQLLLSKALKPQLRYCSSSFLHLLSHHVLVLHYPINCLGIEVQIGLHLLLGSSNLIHLVEQQIQVVCYTGPPIFPLLRRLSRRVQDLMTPSSPPLEQDGSGRIPPHTSRSENQRHLKPRIGRGILHANVLRNPNRDRLPSFATAHKSAQVSGILYSNKCRATLTFTNLLPN